MRRSVSLLIAGGLALVAGAGLAGWIYQAPTTLSVAVARDTEEYRLMSAAAQVFARQKAKVRLRLVATADAAASAAALDRGDAQFAVARTDVALPKRGQTAVILYVTPAVMIVPPGSAVKRPNDFRGLRVGYIKPVGNGPANLDLLDKILNYYGAPPDTTPRVALTYEEVADALAAKRVDLIFAAGPNVNGKVSELVNLIARTTHEEPTFVAIPEAKALADLWPGLQTLTISRGAYSGAPALPAADFNTVAVSTRLMASSAVLDALVGEVTRTLFAERGQIAALAPSANRMEAPSTAKGSALPAHPGAAAYIDGEEETFFERYSDAFYIGAMLLSVLASAAAALFSRFDSARRERSERLIEELLKHLSAARAAASVNDLDALETDADRILVEALNSEPTKSIEPHRITALVLAMDQLRLAIRDRRGALSGAGAMQAAGN